jgi:fumarate hydratase class I
VSTIGLRIPLSDEDVRAVRVGDAVALTGTMVTARDRAHVYLAGEAEDEGVSSYLAGGVIYHCGPVVREGESGLRVVSAGPTTSARMNAYESAVIKRFNVRAVVGKGGMAEELLEIFSRVGCVYLSAYGGCGALYARHITEVAGVFKREEFGSPEALWVLRVEGLPVLVTMDTHGGSLHRDVRGRSQRAAEGLLRA